jgi:hypothetical protein
MTDRCEIPQCPDEAAVTYLGHGVCARHWNELTNENAPPDALKVVLGIAAEPELENTFMSNKKKTQTPEQPAAETAQTDVTAMREKKATAGKVVKVKKAKPAKQAKEKRERKAKEELCVFALRLTPAERDDLHAMAGPARASRFARTVLAAAAQGDEGAFRAAIKEAREARA